MFVKIKLEDPGQSKTPLIFSIEDKATIFDLKTNLESFVNIPPDEQEIQRMDRILDNDDELDKVVLREIDGEKINGAAISLYSNNKFFCFLQFYNKNESDNQNNFFSQPSDAKRLPIDQMPTYIEQLDSDASWQSSSSESDSSYRSRSSSDSSRDSKRSKRKIIRKPDSPTKRLHESSEVLPHSETRIPAPAPSPALTPTPAAAGAPLPTPTSVPVATPAASPTVDQATKNIALVEVEAPQLSNSSAKIATMDSTRNVVAKPAAPYVAMKPDQRRYAVVIHKDIDEQQPDFGRLIEHFYGLFESSRNCGRLNFSESLSITAHDGQLWVLCEDNETCKWIAEGARILSSYKCSSFIKYFGLLKCRVVLPLLLETNVLEKLFQLLELQNSGVRTQKWCVVERSRLSPDSEDYAAQAVTTLCANEVLTLYVDRESKRLIEQHSCKLKYCFWKLTFQF